jgi:hypothetical protein
MRLRNGLLLLQPLYPFLEILGKILGEPELILEFLELVLRLLRVRGSSLTPAHFSYYLPFFPFGPRFPFLPSCFFGIFNRYYNYPRDLLTLFIIKLKIFQNFIIPFLFKNDF